MRFREFLETKDEELIKQYAGIIKQYTDSGVLLYRSMSKKYTTKEMKPGERARVNSADMADLLEWTDSYSQYPDRKKSFICISSDQTPDAFEFDRFGPNLYVVIPADGTNMGVCPTDDFNLPEDGGTTWPGIEKAFGINNASAYNIRKLIHDTIYDMLHRAGDTRAEEAKMLMALKDLFYNYNDSISFYQELQKSEKELTEMGFFESEYVTANTEYSKEILSSKSFIKPLMKYIDLDYNGFYHTTNKTELHSGREVWFNSNALFIHKDEWEDVLALI